MYVLCVKLDTFVIAKKQEKKIYINGSNTIKNKPKTRTHRIKKRIGAITAKPSASMS